jgi:trimethylamine--corrinoid protein Co-methyltransferase
MRHGTTPMGAIETAMIDAAYAQVGKSLNLPTHAYMGASDAKIVDAQAGLESGITAIIGALAGINMISGAGMLDFLACQSAEKLVIDAEAIAMAKRLTNGLSEDTLSLVAEMFEGINFKADFLKQKATRQLFKKEQYIPSQVIDRGSIRVWEETGCLDTFTRAKNLVTELLNQYQRPIIPTDLEIALTELVRSVAFAAGIDKFQPLQIDLR